MDIGIGLWICKKICNNFEGDIKVISDFGIGSMFTFTMKLYEEIPSLF